MALITRVSRLFRADMHALLDRVEEPEILLKQAIREMQENVLEQEKQVKLTDQELTQIASRLTELEHALEELRDELDICFDSDNDTLAKVLLKRKLEAERMQKLLQRKQDALTRQRQELARHIQENRARLTSMQQKAELLCQQNTLSRDEHDPLAAELMVRDEDVEVAFLREKQKRKGA